MTKRFADRDAPAMLRELLLDAFSIKASHAVGPLEFDAGMDKLNTTRHVDVDESTTMVNDEVLMITGRKLLRSMDNATDDVFVLVEPLIGPALNLSRLDFRRGTAHLTQRLATWTTLCTADLEYARAVLGTVRRSIPDMRCRIVTDGDLCKDVVNVIVGQRAVSAVATYYLDRPALAELATDRRSNVAIVFYNGKFLPIIDDRVTDDIMRRWHMLDKEEDDERYGKCVVCFEPAELGVDVDACAHVCNRCNSRVCMPCTLKMDEHTGSVACPVCKHDNVCA